MAVFVAAVAAPAALADRYDDAVARCGQGHLEKPFHIWGDTADYTLLANGSFEAGAADWGLVGNAVTVDEPEPAWVDEVGEPSALLLPRGSAATSSPICVTRATPTIRFFARTNGVSGARLRVEALIKDATGGIKVLPVGMVEGSKAWSPTAPLVLNLNAFTSVSKLPRMGVSFRFTAIVGSWKLDRIYLDPLKDC